MYKNDSHFFQLHVKLNMSTVTKQTKLPKSTKTNVVKPPKYTVGNKSFANIKDAKYYTSNLIRSIGINVIIDSNHEDFAYFIALLSHHLNSKEKIGCGISHFVILECPINHKPSMCELHRIDKTRDTWSWIDCCSFPKQSKKRTAETEHHKSLRQVMRYAINRQILDFRNKTDIQCQNKNCKSSGIIQYHVDHIYSFEKLVVDFLSTVDESQIPKSFKKEGIDWLFNDDDSEFQDKWIQYHADNATLQILCQSCNLTKGSKSEEQIRINTMLPPLQKISLGAINKCTGEYVYPKIANKKNEYICVECSRDLTFCKGEQKTPYFRHKVNTINPCQHYEHPSESQIHKDAKALMKTLLERKTTISFVRQCCSCDEKHTSTIPKLTKSSNVQLEYRFDFNGLKIADVAYVYKNDIVCIFEICNTHKTCSENRPEPWFEIDAKSLITIANDANLTSLEIPCIRCEKCEECIENEKKQQKRDQINSKIKKLNIMLKLFKPVGGTDIEKKEKSKLRKKIKQLEEALILIDNNCESNTDGTTSESFQHAIEKRDAELVNIENNIDLLNKHNITSQVSNNILTLIHPITNTKIRKSLRQDKTQYKGEWRTNITMIMIIKWYKSNSESSDDIINVN